MQSGDGRGYETFLKSWKSPSPKTQIAGEKIKNKIRTFEPEIGQNDKNAQAEIQISSSYKKKSV